MVSVKELLLRCGSSHEILKDLKTVIPIMEALFNAVKRMYELLEEEKKAKNVLDFSDLELLALHILARPDKNGFLKTELAYSYESSFEEILVDEYQDINEVQDMIFRALSRKEQNLFWSAMSNRASTDSERQCRNSFYREVKMLFLMTEIITPQKLNSTPISAAAQVLPKQ